MSRVWTKNSRLLLDNFDRVRLCGYCPCDGGPGPGPGDGVTTPCCGNNTQVPRTLTATIVTSDCSWLNGQYTLTYYEAGTSPWVTSTTPGWVSDYIYDGAPTGGSNLNRFVITLYCFAGNFYLYIWNGNLPISSANQPTSNPVWGCDPFSVVHQPHPMHYCTAIFNSNCIAYGDCSILEFYVTE